MSNSKAPPQRFIKPEIPNPAAATNSSNKSPNLASPDPLLRDGAFIDPASVPQSTPPSSSSANGASSAEPSSKPRGRVFEMSWLPQGWLVEERVRCSGGTAGTVDKYYFDPTSGRRFRSKREVQNFLETGSKRKKPSENSDANANSSEGTLSSSKKKKKSKKPPKEIKVASHLDFNFSNVPDSVEWVLADSKSGTWNPFVSGKQPPPDSEREVWDVTFKYLAARSVEYTTKGKLPVRK